MEPSENKFDDNYLDQIERIVKMNENYGIYTLLDAHQDCLSEVIHYIYIYIYSTNIYTPWSKYFIHQGVLWWMNSQLGSTENSRQIYFQWTSKVINNHKYKSLLSPIITINMHNDIRRFPLPLHLPFKLDAQGVPSYEVSSDYTLYLNLDT